MSENVEQMKSQNEFKMWLSYQNCFFRITLVISVLKILPLCSWVFGL